MLLALLAAVQVKQIVAGAGREIGPGVARGSDLPLLAAGAIRPSGAVRVQHPAAGMDAVCDALNGTVSA